jgi:hypothetical protein
LRLKKACSGEGQRGQRGSVGTGKQVEVADVDKLLMPGKGALAWDSSRERKEQTPRRVNYNWVPSEISPEYSVPYLYPSYDYLKCQ